MMFPRLYLARNLLREDGTIFISIGDDEVGNLRKLCDEVFGEYNFVSTISRMMKSGGAKGTFFTPNIDYVLVYAKDITQANPFRTSITDDQIDTYYNKIQEDGDRQGERYGEERLFKASLDPRPNQRYWIECPDGSFVIPPGKSFPKKIAQGEKVLPTSEDKVWKWTFDRYESEFKAGNIVFKRTSTSGLLNQDESKAEWNIYNKLWLKDQQDKGKVPSNFIGDYENRQSSAELQKLSIPFDYAKPTGLLKHLLQVASTRDDDIVMDFFAGSGSFGDAVLRLNEEDGHNRRFVLVQLPEPCDEQSEEYKAGFGSIADIAKERIRRVIADVNLSRNGRLDLEQGDITSGLGVRVFKLNQSNFHAWRGDNLADDSTQLVRQLELHVDHVNESATPEDILFELLLKAGFQPSENITYRTLADVRVFSISEGSLLICLEEDITPELIDAVAEAEPMQFICLDKAFKGNDQLKANAVQTFAARNQGREKAEQIIFRTV